MTRPIGYAITQRCRKRIEEEVFGWIKASAGLAGSAARGAQVDAILTIALAVYNLIRLPKLLATA